MNQEELTQAKEKIEKRFKELSEQKRALEEELLRLQGEYRLLETFKVTDKKEKAPRE